MLNKWKCAKCGKVVTKYQTICDGIYCDGRRGFCRWLLNWDNPAGWCLGMSILVSVTVLVIIYR